MIIRTLKLLVTIAASVTLADTAFAQAAGAGADFNKADRAATAREAERQRVEKYDKPIRPDPIGNALIGGSVAGAVAGASGGVAAGAAAAAASTARGAAIGTAVEKTREKIKGQ